jgi:hypothetical protein
MDIDANRQRRPTPVVCYRCQATGHLAKACPQRYDIRHLTPDEKRDYVETFMAELDRAPEVEEATGTTITEGDVESDTQDFHANSG